MVQQGERATAVHPRRHRTPVVRCRKLYRDHQSLPGHGQYRTGRYRLHDDHRQGTRARTRTEMRSVTGQRSIDDPEARPPCREGLAEPEQYGDGGSSGFLRPRRPASKCEFPPKPVQTSGTAISLAGTNGLLRCLNETITMGGQYFNGLGLGCCEWMRLRPVTCAFVFVRGGFDGKQRRSGGRCTACGGGC